MNDQHIGFILWVCLYPVCLAVTQLIYALIRKANGIPRAPYVDEKGKLSKEMQNKIKAGCFTAVLYWVMAWVLW
jgi:hypothetical protein